MLSLADGCQGVELAGVLVVDNASADDSVAIAESVPHVPLRIVQVGVNAGYAAAIISAVRQLDTSAIEAVLVLNPDTQLRPGSVALLTGALDSPGRGIVVSRLINSDGTLQLPLSQQPTVSRALAESLIEGDRAGRFGGLTIEPEPYRRRGPAAWATDAVLLISTTMMREIGPWEESFPLYGEKVEFALRAANHCWVFWYEPDAIVEHIGGGSSTNPMLAALLVVNWVGLFRARCGQLAGAANLVAVTAGELIRAATGRIARAALVALLCPSRRITALPGGVAAREGL